MKKIDVRNFVKWKREDLNLVSLGFTLVELLAVIVILAIVLIIAVPGVLSIINKTRDSALDRQKDMIKEASRLYVTSDNDVTWVGQDTKSTAVTLDTLKTKGYLDQKIMDPKTKKEITCAKTVITKTGSKYDYDVTLCDQVNASPRLSSNMIPIVYKDNRWVKADYTNKNNAWYNYDNQQWANMATVTESTRDKYRKADIGSEVKMEDINAMFVWIPRFKYKLFNVDGTISPVGNSNLAEEMMIDVQLENVTVPKSKGTQNGEWLTHPAFTFGGQELEGFWVAKFESGYNQGNVFTEEGASKRNEISPNQFLSKPNIYSWRGITLSKAFYTSLNMKETGNSFGLTVVEDPHLIRTMEWGAMAYLANSKYGKAGNPTYSGVDKEVAINNSLFYTGCGGNSVSEPRADVCQNEYATEKGQAASTTGNISGVYDASGGANEFVGSVGIGENNEFEVLNSEFVKADLIKYAKQGKYLDVYDYNPSYFNSSIGKLGDAMREVSPIVTNENNSLSGSWYNDRGTFPVYFAPFTYRGGSLELETKAGIMGFNISDGTASTMTFRVTLL